MGLKILCESRNSQDQRQEPDQNAAFHIRRALDICCRATTNLSTMTDQQKGTATIAQVEGINCPLPITISDPFQKPVRRRPLR
jgi:hypothetical protein